MNMSASIAAIAEAFAAAQSELENVTKDKVNPAFKSQYATLAAVLDVVRPVMAKHGIAIIQAPGNNEHGHITVTTTLAHKSGEWMSSTVVVPTPKNDAQGVGSAISYGRRYSLAAMCGVAQEDDDGNAASTNGNAPSRPVSTATQPSPRPQAPAPQKGNPVDSAKADVRRWISAMGVDREEAELLVHLDNLTPDDFRPEYRRIKDAFDAFTANGK